jgi:AP-1 complex subunit gamma-1
MDRYAPSKRWHIDTIISVLSIAGNYTKENVATDLIVLICRAKLLNSYAVHKLFSVVKGETANLSQVCHSLFVPRLYLRCSS